MFSSNLFRNAGEFEAMVGQGFSPDIWAAKDVGLQALRYVLIPNSQTPGLKPRSFCTLYVQAEARTYRPNEFLI